MKSKTSRIRELNDLARTALGVGGTLLQTAGINVLPEAAQSAIREAVETFSDFTGENDPYGEHDFGSLTVAGHKVFWKIDYYDKSLTEGSPDPADPTVTARVLTIMLAEEY